jgi:hypothetical protein
VKNNFDLHSFLLEVVFFFVIQSHQRPRNYDTREKSDCRSFCPLTRCPREFAKVPKYYGNLLRLLFLLLFFIAFRSARANLLKSGTAAPIEPRKKGGSP